MGGGVGQFHVGLRQGLLHLGDAEVHQAGMAVRSAAFIGDPIGAQIPLFKDMHGNATRLGGTDRMGVNGAGVAV